MSKSANAGELRTGITVYAHAETLDADGYIVQDWQNVFGAASVKCKWVNAHGTEAIEAQRLSLKDLATLTMRYSPLITPTCIIYRTGDPEPFDIISIDNVEMRNEWLELKVKRRVQAI